MNSRLYALCATSPEDELRADRGALFGALYATLNHIAYADLASWRAPSLAGDDAADPARARHRQQ